MTVTLKTQAARTAVKNQDVTASAAKKIEELASASVSAQPQGAAVDGFDAAKSFPKASKLEGAERALFHAAFKELASKAGLGLAALADAPSSSAARTRPALFSKEEIATWKARVDVPYSAKKYEDAEKLRTIFQNLRLSRAEKHPAPVADALLVLVGTRGAKEPNLDDVFTSLGREGSLNTTYGAPKANGVDVAQEVGAHDTPENRRLVHSILEGFLAMPTTVAGSGAVKYFLGTGSFAGKDKDGVGLLSSGNAWAKAAGWKNADTERVITALFAHHYGSDEFNGVGALLTQPKGGFQGYPEAELFDAAAESKWRASPFAMTHSERNKGFIQSLMHELEGRGLGPDLEVKAPKLNVKLKPSEAKKAILARFEAKWDAAIDKWNATHTTSKVEGRAKDQDTYVWERAAVTRDGVKEQVQTAGGGYGHFQAIVVTSPEGDVKEVFALDYDKVRANPIRREDLKDPSRPWLDRQ